MYLGTPVLAVNSGGPLESIIHQKTGFLCPPQASEFSSCLIQMVRNPNLKQTMGQAAHQHVIDRFGLEAFGRRLEYLTLSMLGMAWKPYIFPEVPLSHDIPITDKYVVDLKEQVIKYAPSKASVFFHVVKGIFVLFAVFFAFVWILFRIYRLIY